MLCFLGVLRKPSSVAHERSVQKFASYSILFQIQNWLAFLSSSDMHLRFCFFLCSNLLLKFVLPSVCPHYTLLLSLWCPNNNLSPHFHQFSSFPGGQVVFCTHILSSFWRPRMPFKHITHERTSSLRASRNKFEGFIDGFLQFHDKRDVSLLLIFFYQVWLLQGRKWFVERWIGTNQHNVACIWRRFGSY